MKHRWTIYLFSFFLAVIAMTFSPFIQASPEVLPPEKQNGDHIFHEVSPSTRIITTIDKTPTPLEIWLDDLIDSPWKRNSDSWTHNLEDLFPTLQKDQDLIVHIKNVNSVTFENQNWNMCKVGSLYLGQKVLDWGGWSEWGHNIAPLELDQTQDLQSGDFYFKNHHRGIIEITFLYTVKSAHGMTHEKFNSQLLHITVE